MHELTNHYEILKVSENAPPEIIKAAFRTLSQKHHPDKNFGDSNAIEVMQKINQAYDVLSNPELRKEHDKQLDKIRQKIFRERLSEMQAHSHASVKTPPPPTPPRPSTETKKSNLFTNEESYPQTRKTAKAVTSRPLQTVRRGRLFLLLFLTIVAITLASIKLPSPKNDEKISEKTQSTNTPQLSKPIKQDAPTVQSKNNKHNLAHKTSPPKQNSNSSTLEKYEYRHPQNLTSNYSPNRIQKKSQDLESFSKNTSNTQSIERIITWPDKK